MKCVSCQSEIPDGSRFCGNCGARQDVLAPAPPEAASASALAEREEMSATLIQAPRFVLPVPAGSVLNPAPATPQSPAAALVAQLGAARPAAAQAPAAVPAAAPLPAPVPVVLGEAQGAVIAHAQAPTPSIIVDEALGAQTTDGGIASLIKAVAPAEAPKPAEGTQPAAAAGVKVGGDGQFRETIWFMDAINPEKLAASEEADIEIRQKELAEASKQSVDVNVRQQYSLAAGGGRKPTADDVDTVKRAAEEEQAAAATGGKSNLALVVAIIVVLGFAAALLFK